MASTNNRARRVIVLGAFAVAAVAAPAFAAAMTSGAGSSTSAQPACLAWYGSRGDGICLSYSNNTPVFVGTPDVSIGGPYSSSPGVGITTGPLLPGSTISRGIG